MILYKAHIRPTTTFTYPSNAFALNCIIYRGIKTRPDQLYTFRNNLIVYYYISTVGIYCYVYRVTSVPTD